MSSSGWGHFSSALLSVWSSASELYVCRLVVDVAKTSAAQTAKDLAGKTIAVNGALTQIAASAWLDRNGVDPAAVKVLDLPYGSMAPALAAKRVDAAVLAEPDLDTALAGDVRVLAIPYDAIARDFMISAWFTTIDYAKAHAEAVRRFEAAILDAGRWANANHVRSGEILARYTKVAVDPRMRRVVYAERTLPAFAQPLIDAAARYKALRAPFPAADIFYVATLR